MLREFSLAARRRADERRRRSSSGAGATASSSTSSPVKRASVAKTSAHPLQTVEELLAWRPSAAAARNVSRVPLPDSAIERFRRPGALPPRARAGSAAMKRIQPPRLLLCHDYAGGYPQWEAAPDGVVGADCPEDSKLWRFNYWAYVDIFVYFSHSCVTIPPVGYIHAAHRHGALVLGTLLFEWEKGAVMLKSILSSFMNRAKAANQLAAIAKFFGFDGWLVNIECALPAGASAASDLAAFVGDISRAVRKLLGPASEVIWYDAVTRKGELRWQNELNDENDPFFKAAGAIFTNYHWDRNAPVRSAVKAGPRRTDVFTGIDIHGRNTFGGGGFQTHVALRAIKHAGTSAALFAPAWTVEGCPSAGADTLEIEERFWTGTRSRYGRECVAQYFRERAVLTQLPFATCFDPGWGPRTLSAGVLKDDQRYFNMSRQDVQPSFLRAVSAGGDATATDLSLSHEQALNGSASVKVTFAFSQSPMISGSFAMLRLFVANVSFPKSEQHNLPHLSSALSSTEHLRISYQYLVGESDEAVRPKRHPQQPREKGAPGERYSDNDKIFNSELPAARALTVPSKNKPQEKRDSSSQFALVLLFASPPTAVLLVSAQSAWHRRAEESGAARRLEVLGKFVPYQTIVPSREHAVRGSPKTSDGAPSWMSRIFEIPTTLTSGQRLSEVMILVGEPPTQPLSVRPSPLATPSQSRGVSRQGSRIASRVSSRTGSRAGSPPRSEAGSSTSKLGRQRPRTRIGAELLSAGILGEEENARLHNRTRESFRKLYEEKLGLRSKQRSKLDDFDEDFLLGDDEIGGAAGNLEIEHDDEESDRHSFRSRSSRRDNSDLSFGSRHSSQLEGRSFGQLPPRLHRQQSAGPRYGGRSDEVDYSQNFAVGGSIDYSQMDQEEDGFYSASTSRAISRLGSRLGTPGGSRTSSRLSARLESRLESRLSTRLVSRQGSFTGSLANSRLQSRSGSRVMSPTETPSTGGGSAKPVRSYSSRVASGSRLNGVRGLAEMRKVSTEERLDDLRSGSETPRSSVILSDLKSALMSAAGSMASGNSMVHVPLGRDSSHCVFLGGLSLEIVDEGRA